MHSNLIDLTGKRFGKLVVIERSGRVVTNGSRYTTWNALCDCGNLAIVRGTNLKSGTTTSCGCASSRNTMGQRMRTHGKRSHRLYPIWFQMKQRCGNENNVSFHNYGARGIRVCKKWDASFQAFLDDMESTWKPGLTIERKNNNGNYSAQNCRWATRREQLLNYRGNRIIKSPWGKLPLSDAARRAGLRPKTVEMRALKGWPESKLLEPLRTRV